jgi:phosphate starvation-inducible protein PhoH
MALTLTTAKVKFPAGKVFPGQYGDRVNVVLTPTNGGEEIKLWGNPDSEISQLKKGQEVQVINDGKGFKLAAYEAAPEVVQAPATGKEALTLNQAKKRIAADVEQSAKFFRFCYETAQQQMQGLIDDPSELRAIATTLFIQGMR